MKTIINVGKDFSRYPSGRTYEDSQYCGLALREMILEGLKKGEVQVDLSGTIGYGSSFLEETFKDLPADKVSVICSEDHSYADKCYDYMDKSNVKEEPEPKPEKEYTHGIHGKGYSKMFEDLWFLWALSLIVNDIGIAFGIIAGSIAGWLLGVTEQ